MVRLGVRPAEPSMATTRPVHEQRPRTLYLTEEQREKRRAFRDLKQVRFSLFHSMF